MQIAITADCHLHPSYPERKETLKFLFQRLNELGINILIIAGDLYDKETNDYSSFDEILKNFPEINVYLIPGNHDAGLEISSFTASNLKIINHKSSENIIPINNLNFLFIPYLPEKSSMDEAIEEILSSTGKIENLVLVSHGDYITKKYEFNLYEEGIYFPLTFCAVEKYKFLKVFLGHIHKPTEYGKIFYPGSPCPVDSSEVGKRSFIIFDTNTLEVKREYIDTPYIFMQEFLTIYPFEDELNYVKENLENKIKLWNFSENELNKIKLKLIVTGYTKNKRALNEFIKKFFSEKAINLVGNEPILEVKDFRGEMFEGYFKLYENVLNELNNLELMEFEEGILVKEEVKKEILRLLFEEKS